MSRKMLITIMALVLLVLASPVIAQEQIENPKLQSDVNLLATRVAENGSNVNIPDGTGPNTCGAFAYSYTASSCGSCAGISKISSIVLDYTIRHTYIGDLRVYLCGPTGCILLRDRTGGSSDNIVVTGQIVNSFNGSWVNYSSWSLAVSDCYSSDTGYIDWWRITINYTPATPSTPSLNSPANGSTVCNTRPTLCWYNVSGATNYALQLDNDSSFSSPIINSVVGNVTCYTVPSALSPGTYYWRIYAWNARGYGSASSTRVFTISSQTTSPLLVSPPTGSTTTNRKPIFSWHSSTNATIYRLQVDNDRNFSSAVIDITTSGLNYTAPTSLPLGTYYWHVNAGNVCSSSDWSGTWVLEIIEENPITPTFTPTPAISPIPTPTVTNTPLPSTCGVTQRISFHQGWNWFSLNVVPCLGANGDCSGLSASPNFSQFYGIVTLDGQPAPVGTLIEFFSPRGERVGCFIISNAGIYPYTRAYGEDTGSNIPGMRLNEKVTFKVNGSIATTNPANVNWQNDKLNHQVDLSAISQAGIGQILSSIAGKYNLVLGENGTYAPPPADQRFNTLTNLQPGFMYMINMREPAELAVNGNPIDPSTPLAQHSDWNWLGYLPNCQLSIASALSSIAGRYSLVLGENGTYAPPPADQRFNTLSQMKPGEGYMVFMTGASTLTYPNCPLLSLKTNLPAAKTKSACGLLGITPYFTQFFGEVTINGVPAQVGTTIEMISPNSQLVGCVTLSTQGLYPYTRVYGEDTSVDPPIAGMKEGDIVTFRINGQIAQTNPNLVVWQNDKNTHQVNLNIVTSQATITPKPKGQFLPLSQK